MGLEETGKELMKGVKNLEDLNKIFTEMKKKMIETA
jgi:hypothetical protein